MSKPLKTSVCVVRHCGARFSSAPGMNRHARIPTCTYLDFVQAFKDDCSVDRKAAPGCRRSVNPIDPIGVSPCLSLL